MNNYHAIDLANIDITTEMAERFYEYMTLMNRSVFYFTESDSELIAEYGLSRDDIRLLHEAHLTYLNCTQAHTRTIARAGLSADFLTELVQDEFSQRVQTIKQQNSFIVGFKYKTSSNITKVAVYTITAPEGVGFHLHCHTYKPGTQHKFNESNAIELGLRKYLMTETKPKRLGASKPLTRVDVYNLIKADVKKRSAELSIKEETAKEAELDLPYETTLFQRRLISQLDELDFPNVGQTLTEYFADNNEVPEEVFLSAIINKKVDDRYELLDAKTFNVLGYLDKTASREQLAMASTVCVTKGKSCFKLAERI